MLVHSSLLLSNNVLSFLFSLGGLEDSTLSKDVMIREVFNEYAGPPLSAIWNLIWREKIGLHPDLRNILEADPIKLIWRKSVNYLNKYIYGEKRGIFIAWNGSSCDMEWLYCCENPKTRTDERMECMDDKQRSGRGWRNCCPTQAEGAGSSNTFRELHRDYN